jgi:hypothetical protein
VGIAFLSNMWLFYKKINCMKKVITFLLLTISTIQLLAQNVKKIEKLTDAFNLTYNYTGEVKDGKPNGMGVASYVSGNVIRYAGNFVNGMYAGKGTMIFDNGAFLTGNWKNGKLNGKGANLTADGGLYIGDFLNGLKNGKGTLFFKDNKVVKGNFWDDKMNGRCISIWADGSIISEINYVNDKMNGTGYQYEVKTKKLYEGEWKDDKWVQAATPSFNSFLKAQGFIGESTENHILIGPVNSAGLLKDTAFYYDIAKKGRYFGYYENGNLQNGYIRRNDSTIFLGTLNKKGATGFCYDYKVQNYYSEGNYTDDVLDGQILDIDLKKKSVYYGASASGLFTGKAYFFNEKGTIYAGDYLKGKFTGTGYRMDKAGKFSSGTWDDGKITKLTTMISASGEMISGNPKSFAEGLGYVIKNYEESFDDITGASTSEIDDETSEFDDFDVETSKSLINIPGSNGANLIATDFDENNFFYAKFLQTNKPEQATAKYKEIIKQVLASSFSIKGIPAKLKLTGTTVTPDFSQKKSSSVFSFPQDTSGFNDFKVWVVIEKISSDKYIVFLQVGKKDTSMD